MAQIYTYQGWDIDAIWDIIDLNNGYSRRKQSKTIH